MGGAQQWLRPSCAHEQTVANLAIASRFARHLLPLDEQVLLLLRLHRSGRSAMASLVKQKVNFFRSSLWNANVVGATAFVAPGSPFVQSFLRVAMSDGYDSFRSIQCYVCSV